MESSRRRFILRATATGAFVVLAPLTGCGRGKGREENADAAARSAPPTTDPCADVSGLTDEQRDFRDDAGYVAETPNPAERCDNCEYWEPPRDGTPRGGASCGGCTVLAGPIHPGGYCDLWEAQS